MSNSSIDKLKSNAWEAEVADRRSTGLLGRRKTSYERNMLRREAELKLLQMKADELAAIKLPLALESLSVDKLFHELYVHQIELEMQNEELRSAHMALEESRDTYLSLFDFAPVGYMTLTESGLISEINFTAAALLGVERKKLYTHSFYRFISEECADKLHLCIKSLIHQHEKQSTEIRIKREDGKLCCVHVDVMRVETEVGEISLRLTLTDITEQKQAERVLRIAAIAFEAQEAIIVTDIHTNVMRVNQAFTRLTGYTENEVKGQAISLLKSGRHDSSFYQNVWSAINQEGFWQGELWNKRKNGEVFPVLMTITTVFDEHQQPSNYVGSYIDITQQKQAEKMLLDDRNQLEKMVEKSVMELNQLKEEGSEVNSALKVMIKLRQSETIEAKNLLILELKQEVMPFLQKLKYANRDTKQVRLLNALDANLQRLISSYGGATNLSNVYKNLTPKEIQVASMVREGASTKVIAATLSLSPETISIHRKNIRKKLGLDSKADNLRSFLLTLDQ